MIDRMETSAYNELRMLVASLSVMLGNPEPGRAWRVRVDGAWEKVVQLREIEYDKLRMLIYDEGAQERPDAAYKPK